VTIYLCSAVYIYLSVTSVSRTKSADRRSQLLSSFKYLIQLEGSLPSHGWETETNNYILPYEPYLKTSARTERNSIAPMLQDYVYPWKTKNSVHRAPNQILECVNPAHLRTFSRRRPLCILSRRYQSTPEGLGDPSLAPSLAESAKETEIVDSKAFPWLFLPGPRQATWESLEARRFKDSMYLFRFVFETISPDVFHIQEAI
jgi:hypothetical protein